MFKNYLIVALRNFRHNKVFSLINILGLSIGLSAALVIYLIVHYNLSFDHFEKDSARIYRVVSRINSQGNINHNRGIPAPLGQTMGRELTGIEEMAEFRYLNIEKQAVPSSDPAKPAVFRHQNAVILADNHYLHLLPYRWLAGSAVSALNEPGRVVLTEARAKIYFPSQSYGDMIGRKIIYDDSITTVVSGVVEDLDRQGNTDFNFKEFISLATLLNNKWMREDFSWDDWGSVTSDQQLYVRLQPGISTASIESGLKKIDEKYSGVVERKFNFSNTYLLQPFSDLHFNADYGTFGFGPALANRPTLYGLSLVAIFLLLLGCINFINLTTAQASQRAKEIGIRKTMGSSRRQLIGQFLSETVLTTILATGLSLALTPLLLKIFDGFIPDGVYFSLGDPNLLIFLAVLVPVISLLAGFYPALVLSSWQPIQVLKNQSTSPMGNTRKTWIRQTLTVSQFVIAQAFIMATLLVGKQISFLLHEDLGFRKEAIVSVNAPYNDTSYTRRLLFLQQARNIPGVALASLGNDVPSSGGTWNRRTSYFDNKKEVQTSVELKYGDKNYLSLFHIPLLAGRDLLPADSNKEAVINETYMHLLGFRGPQDALGKTLKWYNKDLPIVGVMRDFHAHSLHGAIKPMIFTEADKTCHRLIIAMQPAKEGKSDWKATIAALEKIYKADYPGESFDYAYFDESVASAYNNEQRISKLLKWATGLTVFISCLGLLGLVIYTTNRRTKEIGVRKVLGASVTHIVSILSKDFLKLVIVGFLVATPVAWWALHKWLENFAFRTTMSWWVFALSGLGMIAIALITLGVQTVRAAVANPVKSLRME